ncbi:hypothetical protein GHT06_004993 [Daphnia sinensis]|uniref:Uncharacterized protein n=1 Tax=Daphnia sinensis TaxID=1820382 RepID=A0AAD5KEH9_9CRUS|nr:hypothetical protein GHT06_004993 [Daphnia sinensis]
MEAAEEVDLSLVEAKINFLNSIVELGKNKAKAFDLKSEFFWDSENIAGIEKRLALSLNLKNQNRRYLSASALSLFDLNSAQREIKSWELVTLTIKSEKIKLYKLPTDQYENQTVHFFGTGIKLIRELFEILTNEKSIDCISTSNKKKHYLVIQQRNVPHPFVLFESDNEEECMGVRSRLMQKFGTLDQESEGFHMIEHILLRPLESVSYLFSFLDSEGEIFIEGLFPGDLNQQKSLGEDLVGYGIDFENYSISEIEGTGLYEVFIYNLEHEPLAKITKEFSSKPGAKKSIEAAIELFQKISKQEFELETVLEVNHSGGTGQGFPANFQFSDTLSFVFPDWPSRFQKADFVKFIKNLISENMMAHHAVNLYFLNLEQISRRPLYRRRILENISEDLLINVLTYDKDLDRAAYKDSIYSVKELFKRKYRHWNQSKISSAFKEIVLHLFLTPNRIDQPWKLELAILEAIQENHPDLVLDDAMGKWQNNKTRKIKNNDLDLKISLINQERRGFEKDFELLQGFQYYLQNGYQKPGKNSYSYKYQNINNLFEFLISKYLVEVVELLMSLGRSNVVKKRFLETISQELINRFFALVAPSKRKLLEWVIDVFQQVQEEYKPINQTFINVKKSINEITFELFLNQKLTSINDENYLRLLFRQTARKFGVRNFKFYEILASIYAKDILKNKRNIARERMLFAAKWLDEWLVLNKLQSRSKRIYNWFFHLLLHFPKKDLTLARLQQRTKEFFELSDNRSIELSLSNPKKEAPSTAQGQIKSALNMNQESIFDDNSSKFVHAFFRIVEILGKEAVLRIFPDAKKFGDKILYQLLTSKYENEFFNLLKKHQFNKELRDYVLNQAPPWLKKDLLQFINKSSISSWQITIGMLKDYFEKTKWLKLKNNYLVDFIEKTVWAEIFDSSVFSFEALVNMVMQRAVLKDQLANKFWVDFSEFKSSTILSDTLQDSSLPVSQLGLLSNFDFLSYVEALGSKKIKNTSSIQVLERILFEFDFPVGHSFEGQQKLVKANKKMLGSILNKVDSPFLLLRFLGLLDEDTLKYLILETQKSKGLNSVFKGLETDKRQNTNNKFLQALD